jgi:hypothetical protein
MRLVVPFAVPLLVGLFAAPLAAQTPPDEPDTRAEALQREREQKQREVEPYEQNPVERGMILAERRIIPLLNRDGIYARMGSLTTGSGFAYGAGYRDRSLVRGRGKLDLWAAGSMKQYWALEARGGHPLTPDDRVTVEGHVRRFASPDEEFFGIGPDSQRTDQVAYDLGGTVAGGDVNVALDRHVSFSGGIQDLRYTAEGVDGGSLRSIEQVFDRASAPGLGVSHRLTVTTANFTYDYRQPINARKGGWYRLDVSRYDDRARDVANFTRVDVDLRQYVSFLSERRVLAGRAVISTTDADAGDVIPYFLLPALGGNDSLRGFRAYRFRGPHSLLLQGEYRFEVWSGFDAALFADAGKVAMRREDLNFSDLERDFGIGFRFNTDAGIVARVDIAFGSSDGKHLHVVFGGIF